MSRATDDIAFVLVPPSFSPASFYDKVVPLLEKKGFAAHPVDLKSVNDGEEAPVSMYEDADKIHSVAAQLLDQGKGVVLVASSYGGIPATQATKGLGKEERRAVSKPGAVVSIVYLASFVVPEGSCINDLVAGRMPQNEQKPPDYMSMDSEADGQFYVLDRSTDSSQGSSVHGRHHQAEYVTQTNFGLVNYSVSEHLSSFRGVQPLLNGQAGDTDQVHHCLR